MAPESVPDGLPRRRLGTWLVTGPVGRFIGFWLDFARAVTALVCRRLGRSPRG